ncbi:hypothetical protein ACSQ67_017506 [Phaseolus vulgaris]
MRNTLQQLIGKFELCTTPGNIVVLLIRQTLYIYEALDDVSHIPSGGVHPITLEVMYYIYSVCKNREISKLRQDLKEEKISSSLYSARVRVLLENSLEAKSKNGNRLYFIGYLDLSWESKLRQGLEDGMLYMYRMIELLESSLEANSKNYKNPTLGYVFIMNNRRFIGVEAKRKELGPIFGDDWHHENTSILQQNVELYLRSSWNKIVNLLKLDINQLEPSVAAELMKDNLHWLNEHFDHTCNIQSLWSVCDEELREQIIKSIENILLPAYGSFIGRFEKFVGKNVYKYIKYGIAFLKSEKFTYYEGGELHPNISELVQNIRYFCANRDRRSRQGLEKSTMLDKEGKLSTSVNVAREIVTALIDRILEVESKNYHNPSLGYVFVMNNLRFIELQAELYGLVPTFGHGWLRKNTTKFQKNLELYLRSSWNKIVEFLKLDMSESESSVAVGLLKDRLNSFNEHFDEICNVECTWFVFDEELRKNIIKSIENMLLPTYGNFIGKLQKFVGTSPSVTQVYSPQTIVTGTGNACSQPHPVIDMVWPSRGITRSASQVVSPQEGGAPRENIDMVWPSRGTTRSASQVVSPQEGGARENIDVHLIRQTLHIYEALDDVLHIPSGGIHPVTLEVMYYIYSVYKNREISKLSKDLKEEKISSSVYRARVRILLGKSLEAKSKNGNKLEVNNYIKSLIESRERKLRQGLEDEMLYIYRMIELLESSLEANSKIYKNSTLGYVFIMNNRRFIGVEAKLNELGPIFGDDWLHKNTTIFQQNLELYLRSSWNKIVNLLKLDINQLEPSVAAELMKDKLFWFNEHFDETCNIQSEWSVCDAELREQIIKSIENILLPAYGSFIGRFEKFLGKNAYKYIKYGIGEVQDQLKNLFLIRE